MVFVLFAVHRVGAVVTPALSVAFIISLPSVSVFLACVAPAVVLVEVLAVVGDAVVHPSGWRVVRPSASVVLARRARAS